LVGAGALVVASTARSPVMAETGMVDTEPHTDEDFGTVMGAALGFLAAGPA